MNKFSLARNLLSSAFEISVEEIPTEVSLDSFDLWDSLGHLKVLMAVEEKLNRELTTEESIEIIDLESLENVLSSVNPGS
jgi:acyl carrier protein